MARITVTGTAISILPGMSLPVGSVQVGPIQEFRGIRMNHRRTGREDGSLMVELAVMAPVLFTARLSIVVFAGCLRHDRW